MVYKTIILLGNKVDLDSIKNTLFSIDKRIRHMPKIKQLFGLSVENL